MGTLSTSTPTEIHFGRITESVIAQVFGGMDLTETTRAQYEREVGRFVDWVEEAGWSPDVLVHFKNHLRGDVGLSTNSKAKYLTVAKIFVDRLVALGALPFEPLAPKGFKISTRLKRQPLTREEVSRILSVVETDPEMNVLVHLLYFQGLRGSEARTLRVEDLELENGGFFVRGKGRDGDQEWVRFHPKTVDAVNDYLEKENVRSGPLFPSPSGTRPISQSTYWRRLNRAFNEAGVEANPHAFRKAFVSGLIEGGLDLITVSRFSRHRSIQQLQTYYDRVSTERSFPQFVESLEV